MTLPLLASIVLYFEGSTVHGLMQSCLGFAVYLGFCMLVPFLLAKAMWQRWRFSAERLLKHRYGLTLFCITGANFVVFARFSDQLLENTGMVVEASLVCILLIAVLLIPGFVFARILDPAQALSRIISLTSVNSVLIVILSAEFFGLTEVLVATIYTLMTISMGVPYQICKNILLRREAGAPSSCKSG